MAGFSHTRVSAPIGIAFALLAMANGTASAQGCEVKLGAMGPLSGGATAWGIALRAGVELAAAEANQAGGVVVAGKKCNVSVESQDSKYSAEGAAAAANFFASKDIVLIIGPVGGPEATGVKPVAQRNGQITFNSSYAKDALQTSAPLAFHQLTGPGVWAKPLVKAAKERFNLKSVVVVAPNDQGGTDVASADAAAYKHYGIATTEEYYQRGTNNFAPIVARIMRSNPDAVDTASSPPADGATLVKQLLEAGFKGVFGRLGGPGTPEIVRAAGGMDALKNFYWLELVAIDDPKVRSMLDDYKKVMKTAPPDNTLLFTGASAARMVLKAVTAAGTATDTTKIAAALRALPVTDPYLGNGAWVGQQAYGINQELAFPVGMGVIADGKALGVSVVDVSGKD
ncbi:MAG: Extracellular ligand-binding receptor [Rhizobacter sp.]|nr:Extracellular ligand-binding receptor [Rhizobacter sp.]